MRQFVLTLSFTALLLFGLVATYALSSLSAEFASAQSAPGDLDGVPTTGSGPGSSGSTGSGPGSSGSTGSGPGNPGTQSTGGKLINPLQSDSITEFLVKIIDVLLIFAVPIIILFIMYAGFLYVTARGDTTQISRAHSALTWSVVGGVIALGAKLIISVIQGTIINF